MCLRLNFHPIRLRLVAAALAVLGIGNALAGQTIINAGFESPGGAGTQYTPGFGGLTGITGWTFGASGGASYDGYVSNNGFFGTTGIPEGVQGAFIQGTGSFSQDIDFGAGTYTLSFFIEARGGGGQPLALSVGGVGLTFGDAATITPLSSSEFNFVTSDPFSLSAGTHALIFAGTMPFGPTDLTTFIDDVSIALAVPEPATWLLLGLGASGLLIMRRRRCHRSVGRESCQALKTRD